MATRIPVDGIEPGQFDQLVKLLSESISKGVIRPVFRRPDTMVFELQDREAVSNELKTQNLPKSCMSQLQNDISIMASAILTGKRQTLIRFLADHSSESDDNRDDVEYELKARIDRVENVVVTQNMARDFATKRSSKGNTLVGATWEILERLGESSGDTPPDLTFAMLNLNFEKPTDASGLGFFPLHAVFAGKNDTMSLTLTASDLEYLSETLQEAARAIRIGREVD